VRVLGGYLAGAVVVAALASLLLPGQAIAWELAKSTNGVIVARSFDDTSSANVVVYRYWDYKGGSEWVWNDGGNVPLSTGSYSANNFLALGGAWGSVEVPLKSGYRCQLLRIVQSGRADELFAVLNEPLAVQGAVSVEGTVPVALSGETSMSISADSTLPVQVAGVAGVSDRDFGLLLILVGGVLGFAAYRGLASLWSVHRD